MALGSFTSFSLGFHDSAVLHCTKMWDSGVDLLFSVLIIPIPCWISRWHCRLGSQRSLSLKWKGKGELRRANTEFVWKITGAGVRQQICLFPRRLLRDVNLRAKDDGKKKTSPLFYLAFFIVLLIPRISSLVTRVCCSPLFPPKRAKDKANDDDDNKEEKADFAQLRTIIQLKQTLI